MISRCPKRLSDCSYCKENIPLDKMQVQNNYYAAYYYKQTQKIGLKYSGTLILVLLAIQSTLAVRDQRVW